ncbi:MAG: acyl carrier protein [Myxococcaceae bacterium]
MDPRQTLRSFVTTNFYVTDPKSLSDEASLLDQGIVDSTGVLELVAFLESEFGVTMADDEIVPENLESIGNIAAYLARKRA